MKPAKYVAAARRELHEAMSYGELAYPGRGLALEAAVERVVRHIRVLPHIAPRWRGALDMRNIRCAKVKRHPYLVIYEVRKELIVIVAIAHTSRAPGYWRERIAP